jgi:DNA polymerase-3 subunit alpha
MLDALVSVDQMFDKAKELGMAAAGVTDHGTLAAHFDAFKASKRTGVKLVPGCEAYFVHSFDPLPNTEGKRKKNESRKHLILLAQNETGYRNLLSATYKAFGHSEISMGRVYPRLGWDILREHAEGLICTSACGQGIVAEKLMLGDEAGAKDMASRLAGIFPGRFFLEIQPHHLKVPRVDQELVNAGSIRIARELGLPLVAGVDTHYLSKGMAKYKDMFSALRLKRSLEEQLADDGPAIDEFYMKSGDEVFEFLAKYYGEEVAAEAVGNTVRIAEEMCGEPEYLKPTGNHLPVYHPSDEPDYTEFLEWRKGKVPDSLDETAAFMRFRCFKSFMARFGHRDPDIQAQRWERVKYEIRILEKNKFSSYMLVVADFINWAKSHGILVGVGRGSVGGCLVGYLLGIHGVDPFDYDLMFERFQNAEKKSLPDIDTDFTSAGRDIVEEYVRGKYGYDRCAQVSNINTFTPKNTISELARSMRIGGGDGKNYFQTAAAIKDSIPEKDEKDRKITTLQQALDLSPKFQEFAAQYPELMEHAKMFIGLEKEYSTHAAGMVVSDVPLIEFAPLRVDKDGKVAVQLEKNRCEELGLVKMDFLAISTLDIIDEALKNIAKLGEKGPESMEAIPLDDPETYAMIAKGHTRCVFQLGKTGMMAALCKQIKPKNIIDLAIVNALGRPSSKIKDKETDRSEREEFVGRRCGDIPVSYLHSSLEFLRETNGLCIMEEQLMGVAQNVAGWNLNKADGLRKLTKLKEKGKDLAAKLEKEFVEGAVQTHSMTPELAQTIWDKVVGKFGGYGFNRSHAVFYSINGYYTAWLKHHHPAAFMAAKLKIETSKNSITSDDEIDTAKQECRRLGIRILPPDVNRSGTGYEVVDAKMIIMGLAAIKGLGEKAASEIVSKRPYSSFVDFLHRTDARVVNKSKLEAMAKAGCFDSLGVPRRFVFEAGKDARERLKRVVAKRMKDGYAMEDAAKDFSLGTSAEWDRKTLLEYEADVLGQCLSGSINEIYGGFFTGVNTTPLSRLKGLPNRHEIVVEVLVKTATREFTIRKDGRNKGRKMIKYSVEDIEGTVTELTVWPDQYEMAKRRLGDGIPIRAQCQVSDFNGQKTLMLMKFQEIYGEKNVEKQARSQEFVPENAAGSA